MAESWERGHRTFWDGKVWRYKDTGEAATGKRSCARCGKPPTGDGHDACLGCVPGATSACCGHGVHNPICCVMSS